MALENSLPISISEAQEPSLPPSAPEKLIGNRGLTKRILRRGTTWQTPSPGDEVQVHYSGNVKDKDNECSLGSSRDGGAPFKFKLGQGEVIEGLDVGVATMKKGERAIFMVPPQLAYGEVGFLPLVPPNSTLIFDVEMISWSTIRDITGDGGVLKRIITEGEGWATPKYGDEVSVKYVARLEDGNIVSKSEDGVQFHIGDGQLCPAIHKAVKTMRKNEEAELSVKFSYGFEVQDGSREDRTSGCLSPSSNITILLQLISWRSVVDIVGDKMILKKIISNGEGFDRPNEGSLVKVIYVGKREDGTIFDQKGSYEEPFEYVCLEEQVNENLDRATMSMKKGEKAQVSILPDNDKQRIEVPETEFTSSRLIYEVELLDFIKAVKCIEFNHGFSDEEKCVAKALMLSCELNNAACKLKLGDYVRAEALCSKVLELDPDNIKALFRRSQAYQHTYHLDKAEADIKRALRIDSNNRDIKLELKVIKAKQKEHSMYQAELFSTMVSKMF